MITNEILIIAILFFALLVIVNFFFYMKIKKKNIILEKKNQLIKQQNEELKQTNKTIKKTFSIVSHDLRSPYNSLLGYSNYIIENFEDLNKEELRYYLSIINKVAQKNYNFTQQLLNWSLKQQNGIIVNKQNNNLNEIVDKSINTLIEIANQKQISIIKKYIPSNEALLYFDADILFNVCYNIINNAIKYSDNQTSITIKTYLEYNNFYVEIKDEGTGMDEDMLKKLNSDENINEFNFIKFEKEYQGGFGLLYCKELIKLHEGKLFFESVRFKETKVTIQIKYDNSNKKHINITSNFQYN